ncbi:MAG: dockerin type I domain-containing protein [bacterium]
MKKLNNFIITAIFIVSPLYGAYSQNLLENPSFEVWGDDLPEHWLSETNVVITKETDPVFDGIYSVGMETLTNNNRGLYQDIPVIPGTLYDFSAYFYGSSAAKDLGLYLGWLDSDGVSLGGAGPAYNTDSGDYELVSLLEKEAPANAAWARCRVRAYADDQFCGYADMVDFHVSGSATPTPDPTGTPSETPCYRNGDVNQDGKLTSADAQLCFLIVLGQYAPSFEEQCSADCNYDDKVTSADAQTIFLAALGQDACFDDLI